MNTIIYSQDFEPITAIDLPVEVLDSAEQKGGILLALKGNEARPPALIRVDCVKIPWVDGTQKPVMIAHQEELALLLKPDWLVGQRIVIRAYEQTLKILTDKIKRMKSED